MIQYVFLFKSCNNYSNLFQIRLDEMACLLQYSFDPLRAEPQMRGTVQEELLGKEQQSHCYIRQCRYGAPPRQHPQRQRGDRWVGWWSLFVVWGCLRCDLELCVPFVVIFKVGIGLFFFWVWRTAFTEPNDLTVSNGKWVESSEEYWRDVTSSCSAEERYS